MRRPLSLAKPFFASVTSRRGFLKTATVGVMASFFSGIRAHANSQATLQRSAGLSGEPSFSRFTDRARKVMRLADEEARRLRHEYLSTEHILWGLLKEGTGVAINVLKNLDVDLQRMREEVDKIVQAGPQRTVVGKSPQTPVTQVVLEHAINHAHDLRHNYVGSEHLLLGLLCVSDGVAARVLRNYDVDRSQVLKEIVNLLGHSLL